MKAWFSSLWKYIRQHRLLRIGIIATLIALAAFILAVWMFGWDWIGFNGGYSQITTTSTSHGTTITTTKPPGKTLWDLLQLLIIPVVLTGVAIWFNRTERKNEQEIASDNQRENTLQSYLDKMSELLLEKDLRKSKPEDEVRNVARIRTLTVLSRLDGKRKGSVLQFLREAGLIRVNENIIDLDTADLSHANLRNAVLLSASLSGANLSGADLSSALLHGANLMYADLREAFMRGAVLFETNLRQADLDGADLSGAQLSGDGNTNLSYASLYGANLSRAGLKRVNLEGARLIKANLVKAYFRTANLKDAVLTGADLREATLWGADLREADLEGADLRGAKLINEEDVNEGDVTENANLKRANLSRANLEGAKITQEQLNQARSLKGATMPDGSKYH